MTGGAGGSGAAVAAGRSAAGSSLWRHAAGGVLLLVAVLFVGSASASPGAGVGSTVLGSGTLEGRLRIAAKGPSDFVVQEIGLAPGGYTGWHSHPGTLLVVVKAGTLTVMAADCRSHTYRAGEAFVETTQVHEGRNLGSSEPVELLVTTVKPAGSPLRVEADPPRCHSSPGG